MLAAFVEFACFSSNFTTKSANMVQNWSSGVYYFEWKVCWSRSENVVKQTMSTYGFAWSSPLKTYVRWYKWEFLSVTIVSKQWLLNSDVTVGRLKMYESRAITWHLGYSRERIPRCHVNSLPFCLKMMTAQALQGVIDVLILLWHARCHFGPITWVELIVLLCHAHVQAVHDATNQK